LEWKWEKVCRVSCNGCFDGLHTGHLFFLGYCLAHGHELVVGLNTDEYIRRVKNREPVPLEERKKALLALPFVSLVWVFPEKDACNFLFNTRPNVHCISEEYKAGCPEQNMCAMLRIPVIWVPRVGPWSSTNMRSDSAHV
jgi:D-beta-D-heptose 7-phosphate kinase/D-beta-D-heptose 1-phosphate adenosyltransferase